MTENIISTNSMNNTTWNPIENLERRQKAFKLSTQKQKFIHPMRALSRRYLKDAKDLGYEWKHLLKKATRDKVINKVIKSRIAKAIEKARADSKQQEIRNIELEKLEDNVKRGHQRLMEKQPGHQTADVLIFQRYDNEKDIPEGRKIAF